MNVTLTSSKKLQKRALRFIYFSDRNENAISLFVDADILPLKFVYYESIANLMFDVGNRIAPLNIMFNIMFIFTIHVLLPLIASIPNLLGYPC